MEYPFIAIALRSNAFFVERLVFGLKIHLSFQYHFFIGAKSLSLEHSFVVSKQPVVAGGRIWRIELCGSKSKCNSCSFICAMDS